MGEEVKFPLGLVFRNLLWIIGAAIILAALSWQEFHVRTARIKWGEALRSRSFRRPFYLGLSLVTAAVAFSGHWPLFSAFAGILACFLIFLFLRCYF